VGVPVGVPVSSQEGLQLLYGHHQFPGLVAAPFPHFGHYQVLQTQAQYHDQEELELAQDQEKADKGAGIDHHTISPESGISSASPLSWQPDSSPSLPVGEGGNYQAQATNGSPPLVNHVNESLSGWAGHSPTSSPSNSSRNSPGPGWATQVDMSLAKDQDKCEDSVQDNDSGLASETSSIELKEKFNLGEIINFVSSSWNSVSRDSSVQVYPSSSPTSSTVPA